MSYHQACREGQTQGWWCWWGSNRGGTPGPCRSASSLIWSSSASPETINFFSPLILLTWFLTSFNLESLLCGILFLCKDTFPLSDIFLKTNKLILLIFLSGFWNNSFLKTLFQIHMLPDGEHYLTIHYKGVLILINPGGGSTIIILCWKITFSSQQNIQLTSL